MLLSVIIPCYNTEKTLQRTVDSVLEQPGLNRENCEILLIDDGSKEPCAKLCDELAESYDFIKAFHKANGGLSSARNYGIEKAQGDYLVFLDSDDWIESDCFDDTTVDIIQHQQKDMYGFSVRRISSDLRYSKVRPVSPADKVIHFRKGGFSDAPMYSCVYRRKIIQDNGLYFFPLKMLEDAAFINLYANFAQSYEPIQKVMYVYWINLNSFYHAAEDSLVFYESYRGMIMVNNFLRDIMPEAMFDDRQLISSIVKFIPRYCACHSFSQAKEFFDDPMFEVMKDGRAVPWSALQANYELWKTNPKKLWRRSRLRLGVPMALFHSRHKKPFVKLKNHIWYHFIKKVY